MKKNQYPNPPSHEWVCKKCGIVRYIQANDPNIKCECGESMFPVTEEAVSDNVY